MLPVDVTVARAGFELCHDTTRPVSALPSASLSVADAWIDCPMPTVDAGAVTSMEATGTSRMLTVAVARLEPTRAVTTTDPFPIPVMTPPFDTVATALLDVDQLLAVPGISRPLSSYNDATSCSLVFALIELLVGVMRIDPIAFCLTAMAAEPLEVPALAMSVASPTPIVEIIPVSLTVTTDESVVDQRTASLEEAPDALDALTANCSPAPNGMLTMPGSTRKAPFVRTTMTAESAVPAVPATIRATPGAMADTIPELLTVAMVGAVLLHETGAFCTAPLPSVIATDN